MFFFFQWCKSPEKNLLCAVGDLFLPYYFMSYSKNMIHKIIFSGMNQLKQFQIPRWGHRKVGTNLRKFGLNHIQNYTGPQNFKNPMPSTVALSGLIYPWFSLLAWKYQVIEVTGWGKAHTGRSPVAWLTTLNSIFLSQFNPKTDISGPMVRTVLLLIQK